MAKVTSKLQVTVPKVIADRFGYSVPYVHLLRHQFTHEKIDFSEPLPEGKARRHRIDATLRVKICNWRERRLSAGEITELLSEEGVEVSVRTIERLLAEEGYDLAIRIARELPPNMVARQLAPRCD